MVLFHLFSFAVILTAYSEKQPSFARLVLMRHSDYISRMHWTRPRHQQSLLASLHEQQHDYSCGCRADSCDRGASWVHWYEWDFRRHQVIDSLAGMCVTYNDTRPYQNCHNTYPNSTAGILPNSKQVSVGFDEPVQTLLRFQKSIQGGFWFPIGGMFWLLSAIWVFHHALQLTKVNYKTDLKSKYLAGAHRQSRGTDSDSCSSIFKAIFRGPRKRLAYFGLTMSLFFNVISIVSLTMTTSSYAALDPQFEKGQTVLILLYCTSTLQFLYFLGVVVHWTGVECDVSFWGFSGPYQPKPRKVKDSRV